MALVSPGFWTTSCNRHAVSRRFKSNLADGDLATREWHRSFVRVSNHVGGCGNGHAFFATVGISIPGEGFRYSLKIQHLVTLTIGAAVTQITTFIPTFRRPRLLARAIHSVLAQSFGDLQLLVLDHA